MEPTIYKPGAYNTPGVYNGAGCIYKGRGVYNDGASGGNTVIIGGTTYPVVKIGNLKWLAINLDYKFSGCTIGGYSSSYNARGNYYGNNENLYGINGKKYGLLYNRPAVLLLNTNSNELLPSGWRVPTRADFTYLRNEAGGQSIAGKNLKSKDQWNGLDIYGLNIVPAGLRFSSGEFRAVETDCAYWQVTDSYVFNFWTGDSMDGYNDSDSVQQSLRLCSDA